MTACTPGDPCGALDCPRCYPGCRDVARCCRCGTEIEAWQADEARWEMDTRGRWVCVDCLGDED